MLVLARKIGESVVIGDNIVVTVVDVRGNTVRLGFSAPRDVPICRAEIYNEIHQVDGAEQSPSEIALQNSRGGE